MADLSLQGSKIMCGRPAGFKRVARRLGGGSTAVMCPACDAAHSRWPRWVPRMTSKQYIGIGLPAIRGIFVIRRFDRLPSSRNALDPLAPVRDSGGARLTPIRLTPHHHRPDNPGDLVGQRDRRELLRLSR